MVRTYSNVNVAPSSNVGYNFPISATQITFSTTCSGLCDTYLMSQADYYKLQAHQPFNSYQKYLGQKSASGNLNDTTAISNNVMVVVVNEDTTNGITAQLTLNSYVSAVVYYFPWFTYSFGSASGVLFILLASSLFVLFIAVMTCILYDCVSTEEKRRRKKRSKLKFFKFSS